MRADCSATTSEVLESALPPKPVFTPVATSERNDSVIECRAQSGRTIHVPTVLEVASQHVNAVLHSLENGLAI